MTNLHILCELKDLTATVEWNPVIAIRLCVVWWR